MRSIRTWPLAAMLAALAVASCSTDAGPSLGDLRYVFADYSHCGVAGCDSVFSAVQHGDTLGFFLSIQDDTPDTAALPRVRPFCATNLVIRRTLPPQVEIDIPRTPTCPDSTRVGGDNWPGSINTDRLYYFGIPDTLPAGTYTVTSKVLAEPRVDRTATFTIK